MKIDQESTTYQEMPIVETNIIDGMSQRKIQIAKVNRISQLSKRSAYSKNAMVMRNSSASIMKSAIGGQSTIGSVHQAEESY
jgi:hypothetical protein